MASGLERRWANPSKKAARSERIGARAARRGRISSSAPMTARKLAAFR